VEMSDEKVWRPMPALAIKPTEYNYIDVQAVRLRSRKTDVDPERYTQDGQREGTGS
jgi:hypothetical protein